MMDSATAEEHAGAGFHVDQARAMKAELERELGEQRRYYPGMVGKGRLDPQEAERRIALFAELLEDCGRAFHPDVMQRRELPLAARRFSWREKIAELRRELAVRERFYPDRVAKGRITEAEARGRSAALQLVHDLYWRKAHCWEPDGDQARALHADFVRRFEAGEDRLELIRSPEWDRTVRAELYTHLRALENERAQQSELAL